MPKSVQKGPYCPKLSNRNQTVQSVQKRPNCPKVSKRVQKRLKGSERSKGVQKGPKAPKLSKVSKRVQTVQKGPNCPKSVQKRPKVSKSVQKLSKVAKNVQICVMCPKLSRGVQNTKTSSKSKNVIGDFFWDTLYKRIFSPAQV